MPKSDIGSVVRDAADDIAFVRSLEVLINAGFAERLVDLCDIYDDMAFAAEQYPCACFDHQEAETDYEHQTYCAYFSGGGIKEVVR